MLWKYECNYASQTEYWFVKISKTTNSSMKTTLLFFDVILNITAHFSSLLDCLSLWTYSFAGASNKGAERVVFVLMKHVTWEAS